MKGSNLFKENLKIYLKINLYQFTFSKSEKINNNKKRMIKKMIKIEKEKEKKKD